ncbi:Leu/Phe/Val dehydrogenase [Salsipaludibacter albus]|uniref:Leu/Phe/Val dehydrogenase n=1 Tax=Salsipaludibacter albus TaxID=2849650 RepID=UPI001EE4BA0B|nr:Glu/Leu/Phe/Val dehydrogenase dimerization domain-containing protein [Salsipaludibacter albus]MBY5160975.1 valine dehydrogenase [Salsipaludibacter albus]
MIFDNVDGHELVVFANDEASGLRAIIAVHSTALGPALGGTRMRPYATEHEALADVLRLSRAMSLKNAAAGLAHGGGKAVIIADPATDKTPALFAAHGRAIDALGGRYVTACDVGTTPADMSAVATTTPWVTGRPADEGGVGDSGVLTAHGVEVGMHAAARHRWGSEDLAGRHVVVQGLGKVGGRLVRSLLDQGATVTVADVDAAAVARAVEAGARAVGVDEVMAVEADVLSPNALGGVLNASSIPDLRVEIVCGGANNQLALPDEGARMLADAGILYAPDYIVNAGGVIAVSDELHPDGHSEERCRVAADEIATTLDAVFARAEAYGITTEQAAREFATERIENASTA